jgi:REP element-mobilizing transposase RayT
MGEIVAKSWKWLAKPNHLHGVIAIHAARRGGSRTAPTKRGKPLGSLIGAFKTVSAKRINQYKGTPGRVVWQRGFYNHIIRNEADLFRIRRCIRQNPIKWSVDRYHPGE